MNYKDSCSLSHLKEQESIDISGTSDELTKYELYKQSEYIDKTGKIDQILCSLKNDLSDQNINLMLNELIQLDNINYFTSSLNYYKFVEKDIISFFFSYIFADSSNVIYTDIVIQNIKLIFKIFTFLSQSKRFANTVGNNFINLFFSKYNSYDIDCHNLGIITVNQILHFQNCETVSNFFNNQQAQNFLLQIFPEDDVSDHLVESLSTLYSIILQKIHFEFFTTKKFYDTLSQQFTNQQSTTFFDNYSQIMLILLEQNPQEFIRNYLAEYFKKNIFQICFSSSTVKGKNAILQIYRILIENNGSKITEFIIQRLPDNLIYHLEKEDSLRTFFLSVLLAAAQKYSYEALEFILNSKYLDEIISIRQALSTDCLCILYQFLAIFVETDFKHKSKTPSYINSQLEMIVIFFKILDVEQDEFQVKILEIIDRLISRMIVLNKFEDVKKKLIECHGVEILEDLAQEYEEAQFLLNKYIYNQKSDEYINYN